MRIKVYRIAGFMLLLACLAYYTSCVATRRLRSSQTTFKIGVYNVGHDKMCNISLKFDSVTAICKVYAPEGFKIGSFDICPDSIYNVSSVSKSVASNFSQLFSVYNHNFLVYQFLSDFVLLKFCTGSPKGYIIDNLQCSLERFEGVTVCNVAYQKLFDIYASHEIFVGRSKNLFKLVLPDQSVYFIEIS